MEQLPMFDEPMVQIFHTRKAGNRKHQTVHTATVYDEYGDPVVFVEYTGPHFSGLKKSIIQKAREAWMKRSERPFGDEYTAGVFLVAYLYELRDRL